jgi:hypothetical protein
MVRGRAEDRTNITPIFKVPSVSETEGDQNVRDLGTLVDLTCQHTSHTVLVEGPEIMISPVGTRRLVAGGP